MNNSIKLKSLIEKKHVKFRDLDSKDSLPVYGVSNLTGITVTAHRKSEDLSNYLVIKEGYLAYNPYRVNVGSIGLTPNGIRGLVSPAYIVFKAKNEALLPEIILAFLKSKEGLRQINKLARGTVRKALRFDDLCQIEFPNLSYQDQVLILKKKKGFDDVFLEVNNASINQKSLIAKLKQAILQEAIQGKLTADWRAANRDTEPASKLLERIKEEKARLIAEKKIKKEKPLPEITPEETPFAIPEGWEWCRLGRLTNEITKGSSPKWQGIKYVSRGEGTLFVTSKNVGSGELLFEKTTFLEERFNEIQPRSILKKNDILTNLVGASIARTALFDLDCIANINQAVALIRIAEGFINKRLLVLYMNSNHGVEYLLDSRFSPGRANVSLTDVSNMIVPIPPLAEHQAIVERVDALMETCRKLEDEIEQSSDHAADLLQAVLKEAFASAS